VGVTTREKVTYIELGDEARIIVEDFVVATLPRGSRVVLSNGTEIEVEHAVYINGVKHEPAAKGGLFLVIRADGSVDEGVSLPIEDF
jgi:hypothetical protein